MNTHLLCAVNVIFSNYRNKNLIKSQRRGDVQGYRTLSDLLVNDNYFELLSYPIKGYDEIYKQYTRWDSIYIPTTKEQYIIYRLTHPWFKVRPVPPIMNNYSEVISHLQTTDYSAYIQSCVATCGACRQLCHRTSPEIEQLCVDILLYIRDLLVLDLSKVVWRIKPKSYTKVPLFQTHTSV